MSIFDTVRYSLNETVVTRKIIQLLWTSSRQLIRIFLSAPSNTLNKRTIMTKRINVIGINENTFTVNNICWPVLMGILAWK